MPRNPVLPLVRLVAVVAAAAFAAALLVVPATTAAASARTPIMGPQQASAGQLAAWYRTTGQAARLPISIDQLAQLFIEEGAAEGVRGDIAFMQSVLETAYFTFPSYGQVRPEHNNYGGIGAVDGGNNPNRFPSPRIGVRAQIQHLRAYADPTVTPHNLAHPLESPRFHLVHPKGRTPFWEQLGGGNWATDPNYATKIMRLWGQLGMGPASGTPQSAQQRLFADVPPDHVHAAAIAWAANEGLVQGSNGRFSPNHDTSRAQLASVLQRFHLRSGEPVTTFGSPVYADVSASHVHATAIAWATGTGVLQGFTAQQFGPNRPTTRAQLASLLYRYRDETFAMPPGRSSFADVPADHVHAEAIAWASDRGIVRGIGGGRFAPNVAVSRAQLAAMLQRLDAS
jgi:hypothetical protein